MKNILLPTLILIPMVFASCNQHQDPIASVQSNESEKVVEDTINNYVSVGNRPVKDTNDTPRAGKVQKFYDEFMAKRNALNLVSYDFRYNGNYELELHYTVENTYSKPIIAFKLGYNHYTGGGSFKNIKRRINPKEKFSDFITFNHEVTEKSLGKIVLRSFILDNGELVEKSDYSY